MGERTFNIAQIGKESIKGTAVAATARLLGDVKVPKDQVPVYPGFNLGIRAKDVESHSYQQLVDGLVLDFPTAYFQLLPWLASMTLKGNITPGAHSGGTGFFDWDHTPALTSASNAQDSFTVEMGDNVQAYEANYLLGKKLTISGAMGNNEPVKASVETFGQKLVPSTFTSAIAIPSIETMIANLTKLYINSSWATKGTTQVTGLLIDYSLEILTGLVPRHHGNGLSFDSHKEGPIDAMLKLTLEGDAAVDAYYDGCYPTPGTPKTKYAIELDIPGSGHNVLKVALWGEFEEIIPLGSEKDGNNLYSALFHGLYDPTGAAMLYWLCTTNVASL